MVVKLILKKKKKKKGRNNLMYLTSTGSSEDFAPLSGRDVTDGRGTPGLVFFTHQQDSKEKLDFHLGGGRALRFICMSLF